MQRKLFFHTSEYIRQKGTVTYPKQSFLWLRRLVRSFTLGTQLRSPTSNVIFVAEKVTVGEFLSPRTSVFPCQYHTNNLL